jgi:hypothetical protein
VPIIGRRHRFTGRVLTTEYHPSSKSAVATPFFWGTPNRTTPTKNGGRLSSPAALINKLQQLDQAYEW